MADTAAHLVDRVLPWAPYRHWVLTVPVPLRLLLLRDSRLLTEVLGISCRRLFAWQRRQARTMGATRPECGAITFVHRAGSALNVNVHFHTVAPDGIFESCEGGGVRMLPLLGPTPAEVEELLGDVATRIDQLVERYTGDAGVGTDEESTATLPLAFAPGPRAAPSAAWEHPTTTARRCAHHGGYSLHADRAIDPEDRAGLGRLCRYGLRSAISLRRLSITEDGQVTYWACYG
jgi:hypothetical protein